MDEQMMRERIRSLEEHTDKLVARSDALKAHLAERDAEIARLGTEVEDMVGQIAYLNRQLNEANQIVRAGEAERKALRQQVAELQAWKDAVPVDALRCLHDNTTYSHEYAPSSGYSVTQYDEDCAITDEWFVGLSDVPY